MRRPLFLRLTLGFALLVAGLGAARWQRHRARHPLVTPLATTPFFEDEFDGAAPNPITRSRLDPLKWQVQGDDQILQRTQWGGVPDLRRDADGTGFVRLSLATFNSRPEKAGRFHLSTQITSLDRWKVESGLEYEARLRADHLPPGLILGFFAYGDAGIWKKTYQKTEADFELLTVQGGAKIWTHIWDNWNPLRKGENDGSLHDSEGFNWNDGGWNTFKIRWYPHRTQWICNDILIREERVVRPGSPMGVWFNLWAPNPDWLDAYSPAIQAAPTRKQNRNYFYDVDYVRVRRIPAAPPEKNASGAPIGTGEGLKGEYFASADLSGASMVRLDPRVDFDWGRYAPESRLPADGFSARWDGLLEARFAELYTFTLKSRNRARLWVDNRLIIDGWKAKGPFLRFGKIPLRAGQRVPIRLEMFNRKGNAGVQLGWSSASTPPEIVPQSQLYLASRPAAPRFSRQSGALLRPEAVEIHSPTRGATIRYTLDGKPPTTSSRVLPAGAKLRVSYTSLVRARAWVENQVPSEVARAFYVLDDVTPPQLAFVSPAPDGPLSLLETVAGTVSDGGSGVTRVDLVITRLSDALRWKEGRWTAEEWGIGATIRASKWSVSAGLPRISDLQPGRYELKAVAYDLAGNIKGVRRNIFIEPIAPITVPVRPKNRQ